MGLCGPKPRRKEVIWTPELAYAVGLIATDGCLSKDGRHLEFTSKDIEQIKNIQSCLGLETCISRKNSGSDAIAYHTQWGDVTLYQFLLNIGLMPAKSNVISSLNIPDEFFWPFLRGHFDGDGCFYSYYDPRWRNSFMYYLVFTSASIAHIAWLRETIYRLSGVRGHITYTKLRTVPNLRFAKREGAIIIERMYKAGGPCLGRKRLKIQDALRIVS